MDTARFHDLYVSEAQEHLLLLQRSLLALEGGDAAAAVDTAFRAAHTVKGVSAAMGYNAVTELAHRLEDRLDGIRAGHTAANGATVDELLALADALEAAVGASAQLSPAGGATGSGAAGTEAAAVGAADFDAPAGAGAAAGSTAPSDADAATAVEPPAGTVRIARIRLEPDAPIKSARALLIMRALAALPGVLGSDPESFSEEFAGAFTVFLADGADAGSVEAAIRAAGDVQQVDVVELTDAGHIPARVVPRPAGGRRGAAAGAGSRAVRVDARRIDDIAEALSELSILHERLRRTADDRGGGANGAGPAGAGGAGGAGSADAAMLSRMDRLFGSLQHDVLALRMVPLREAFERLPRVVRDAARRLDRRVDLVVEGEDVQLDRSILEEVVEPLVHLLRNAVDHGIEEPAVRMAAGKPAAGTIRLTAERQSDSVRIVISDDGRGVARDRVAARARAAGLLAADAPDDVPDDELLRLLAHAGLSTADQVTDVSGRGVGMDVVVTRLRALGGAIELRTETGTGTTFTIRLPVTLALAQALRVRVGDEEYAVPLTHIAEVVELNELAAGTDGGTLKLRGEPLPVVRLRRALGVTGPGTEQSAVIAQLGGRRAALAVDALISREQILVRSFDPVAGMPPYFTGATLLADGRPVLVLDPLSVI